MLTVNWGPWKISVLEKKLLLELLEREVGVFRKRKGGEGRGKGERFLGIPVSVKKWAGTTRAGRWQAEAILGQPMSHLQCIANVEDEMAVKGSSVMGEWDREEVMVVTEKSVLLETQS